MAWGKLVEMRMDADGIGDMAGMGKDSWIFLIIYQTKMTSDIQGEPWVDRVPRPSLHIGQQSPPDCRGVVEFILGRMSRHFCCYSSKIVVLPNILRKQ